MREPQKYLTKRIRRNIEVSEMLHKGRRGTKELPKMTRAQRKEASRKARALKKLAAKKKRLERKQAK